LAVIDTAVIPAAGLGTRMLPATKEQPKEMMPVPIRDPSYGLVFKPFLQLVYEILYDAGIRNFIFVVGRGKRSIEDYFTPDWDYVRYLEARGKRREAEILYSFYRKIESSTIAWVNQPEPRGFGDAVYRGSLLAGDRPFLVHAGDIAIFNTRTLSSHSLRRLLQLYQERSPEVLMIVKRVEDPRHYGVVVVDGRDQGGVYIVRRVVEKPREALSNLAIAAIYVFHPVIQETLRSLQPSASGEVELTDAIQVLIDWGLKVEAIEVDDSEDLIDIGRPEKYLEAVGRLSRG